MANLPEDDLPSKFDVIVDGTGLVQSILAAAVARAGKSVLHIDRNGYYGELWASLMHREIRTWIKDVTSQPSPTSTDTASSVMTTADEHVIAISNTTQCSVSNLVEIVHGTTDRELSQDADGEQEVAPDDQGLLPDANNEQGLPPDASNEQGDPPDTNSGLNLTESESRPASLLSWQSLESEWRRFCFDLIPKVLYCRGALVDLLTQSNCGRYVEFKAVQKIYTLINGKVDQVPCSRSDVFSSHSVSMMEKRKMMKFLTFCSDFSSQPEQFEEFVDVPFVEFLKLKDLPDNLITYIVHSIAMVNKDTPTLKGLEATKLFLNSLGRFGNAPFLYPVFGVGELGQAYCRLCAVFGGVYCLKRNIEQLVMTDNALTGIVCSNGQRIEASAVVCSAGLVRTSIDIGENLREEVISRAIIVTDGPLPGTDGKVSVLTVPPLSLGSIQTTPITILQLDPSTNCAAPGTYLLHLMSTKVGSMAQQDLEPVVRAFCDTQNGTECERGGPHVLWSLYFNVTLYQVDGTASTDIPNGVYLTSDPDSTIAYENAVREAQSIFSRLCPGEEFLPTPPDPRDIIYDNPEEGEAPEETPQTNGEAPETNEEVTETITTEEVSADQND